MGAIADRSEKSLWTSSCQNEDFVPLLCGDRGLWDPFLTGFDDALEASCEHGRTINTDGQVRFMTEV